MKKNYETPDIIFRAFVISENIATGDTSGYETFDSSSSFFDPTGEIITSDPFGD